MCSAHSRPCIDLFGGFLGVIPGHRTEELRRERAANQHKTKQKNSCKEKMAHLVQRSYNSLPAKLVQTGVTSLPQKPLGHFYFFGEPVITPHPPGSATPGSRGSTKNMKKKNLTHVAIIELLPSSGFCKLVLNPISQRRQKMLRRGFDGGPDPWVAQGSRNTPSHKSATPSFPDAPRTSGDAEDLGNTTLEPARVDFLVVFCGNEYVCCLLSWHTQDPGFQDQIDGGGGMDRHRNAHINRWRGNVVTVEQFAKKVI